MKQEKIYNAFKAKAGFVEKFQMVKAYYKSNDSVLQLVGRILRERYNLPWQDKVLAKVLKDAQGKHNPIIEIPQFNFKESVEAIFDKFIENKFDKMVGEFNNHGLGADIKYPFMFRDVIERNS